MAIAIGVAINLVSGLIERVAVGERVTNDEILQTIKVAVAESQVHGLLTDNDFQRALAKLIRRLDLIDYAVSRNEFNLAQQLAKQYGQYELIRTELSGDLSQLDKRLETLATQEQGDAILKEIAALKAVLVQVSGVTGDARIFQVPLPKNPNFTGREDLLTNLRNTLTAKQTAAPVQAIHGLGGVGKSQLALHYAYLHREAYQVVWWARAAETGTLAGDLVALAQELKLPGSDVPNQPAVVDLALAWLKDSVDWLLILDNAPNPDAVKDYMPVGGRGHVLITSQNPAWRGMCQPLYVPPLLLDDAINLLKRRSGRSDLIDRPDAAKVAEILGGLPLALVQAGAYLETHPTVSFAHYLKLFTTRHQELWAREKPPDDYHATVATTWSLAMDEVAKTPGAAELLDLCACLAPEGIPLYLLEGVKKLRADDAPVAQLAAVAADLLVWNDAVSALVTHSLIEVTDKVASIHHTWSGKVGSVSVHRLVQAVARDRLDEVGKKQWGAAAVHLLDSEFPLFNIHNNSMAFFHLLELMPHGRIATKRAEKLDIVPEVTGRLLNHMGSLLIAAMAHGEAKEVLDRALAIDEQVYGTDHPTVARDLIYLGWTLHAQNSWPVGRAHIQRALAIDEQVYGSDHPTVARDLNFLGLALLERGDLPAARVHLERALAIDERVHGPDHPLVAYDLIYLGRALRNLGELAVARTQFLRAFTIASAIIRKSADSKVYDRVGSSNMHLWLMALRELPEAWASFRHSITLADRLFD